MRAWAILMMLQGHFIIGLLDKSFREDDNLLYSVWQYLRGMTAPIFFTVSGFIFTYLLLKNYSKGWKNPRVKKGIKRGIQLIIIGHLLRLYLPGLLHGKINSSFLKAHVLQCIGVSIVLIIGTYLLFYKKKERVLSISLFLICILSFLFKPVYDGWDFSFLPKLIANYFTTANGSVFIIFPWFGYAAFGGFLSTLFRRFSDKPNFYTRAIIISASLGYLLTHFSYKFLYTVKPFLSNTILENTHNGGYLFARLGNVLIVFAIFMLLRSVFEKKIVVKVGGNTLAIFVLHSIILYGSNLGIGFTKSYYQSLPPSIVIPGAILFMILITFLALAYDKYEKSLKKFFGGWIRPIKKLFTSS